MNVKDKLLRFWNFWPPFLFTGIRIDKMSKDYQHAVVRLKLRFWNKNFLGTQFGGLIYAMSDPFYMIMLIQNLGSDYSVWDKAAHIKYLRPGRSDLTAEFQINHEDLEQIRAVLESHPKMDWSRNVLIKDNEGQVVAEVTKILSIKRKSKE